MSFKDLKQGKEHKQDNKDKAIAKRHARMYALLRTKEHAIKAINKLKE